MLNIQRFTCNMLQENCYVVYDETKECVIIDCGAFYPEEHQAISRFIHDNKLTPVHLIATHGHFDHNIGNDFIYKEFGLKVELRIEDQSLIENLADQASSMLGMLLQKEYAPVGHYFTDGERWRLATIPLRFFTRLAIPQDHVCSTAKKKRWRLRATRYSNRVSDVLTSLAVAMRK